MCGGTEAAVISELLFSYWVTTDKDSMRSKTQNNSDHTKITRESEIKRSTCIY